MEEGRAAQPGLGGLTDGAPSADLSAATRREALQRMAGERPDLLVVGGGITGAGIAREAALRGYQVALVEKGDFASGTSSASTKLAHGGLRYLEQRQLGLVFEALGERRVLLRIAPHLVRPLELLFPLYRGRPPHPWKLRAGLALYDLLALGRNLGGHRMLSARAVRSRAPELATGGLRGAGLFYDCWAHDSGLVLATLRDASAAGAAVASYARAELVGEGRVTIQDLLDGGLLEVRPRLVVSAVGAWTDAFLGDGRLRPSKGIHLAFRRQDLPLEQALAISSPRDGRLLFVLPWGAHVYAGTTDTPYQGPPEEVAVEVQDVDYVLEAVRESLPGAEVGPGEVSGSWAGLRPLLRSQAAGSYQSSREHGIWQPHRGVLAIAGGKLTTYRVMARQCVDAAARILSREHGLSLRPPAPTGERPLPGGGPGWDAQPEGDLPPEVRAHLVARFGSEAGWVAARAGEGAGELLAPGLPHLEAEVLHAVRKEMALRVADFLVRRSHLASRELAGSMDAAPRVAELMGRELGWSPDRTRHEVDSFRAWARRRLIGG